jgi:arylsulfatase A-like enzyme
MITYFDDQVGIIMDMLKEYGLDENTIVMFSSDNGPTDGRWDNPDMFRSALNFRGLKGEVYEGGIRAPFIVRWPGKVAAGEVSDLPSAQYDIMATLADLLKSRLRRMTAFRSCQHCSGSLKSRKSIHTSTENTRRAEGRMRCAWVTGRVLKLV